ncbi:MAG: ribonuclease [Microbacteriaceae bacterium]|nr:ribonuclease [Microbacteriaceae bacterium]
MFEDMATLTPRRLTSSGWRFVLRLTVRGAVRNQLFDQAAALTYYAVLSLAPSLVALISIAAIFGEGRKSADALLETVNDVAPDSAIALLKGPLESFAASPSVGIALAASVIIAIWATSSYVACFGRSLNRIYGVEEGRSIWRVRSLDVLIAVVVMLLALVTVAALVLSDPVAANLGAALGIGSTPQIVWSIIKWPVLIIAVTLIVAILYYGSPNAKFPHFRWMSAGALVSVIGVLCVSLLFALYVRNFAHFDRTYSSFAGIVVVLIWIWIVNLVLLFGANFDAQYERARELEEGLPAERDVQLEPRDVKLIDRNAERRRQELAEARRIRAAARRRR